MSAPDRAPVQGYSAGIPWSLHLEAYDVYSKKWSPQPAMIDWEKGCRGGFSTGELDEWIPGWRERASEITDLRNRLTAAQRVVDEFDTGERLDPDGGEHRLRREFAAALAGLRTPESIGNSDGWYALGRVREIVKEHSSVCIWHDALIAALEGPKP